MGIPGPETDLRAVLDRAWWPVPETVNPAAAPRRAPVVRITRCGPRVHVAVRPAAHPEDLLALLPRLRAEVRLGARDVLLDMRRLRDPDEPTARAIGHLRMRMLVDGDRVAVLGIPAALRFLAGDPGPVRYGVRES